MNINNSSDFVNSFLDQQMFCAIQRNNRTLQMGSRNYLCYLANRLLRYKTNAFHFSQQDLAAILNCSTDTLLRTDNWLIEEGIITKKVQKVSRYKGKLRRLHTTYTINRKLLWEKIISQLENIPHCVRLFFNPQLAKKRSCGLNTNKLRLLDNLFSRFTRRVIIMMNVNIYDHVDDLIKQAKADHLDDGRLEYHATNMFSYYSDPNRCKLTAKLQAEGKNFIVHEKGLYPLFKKWVSNNIKRQEISSSSSPKYSFYRSSLEKKENSEKNPRIPEFLFNSDYDLKIKEAVGEVHYVSWFCTKNEDGQWLFRHTLTGNSEDGLLLTISDPFTYSKVSEVFIASRLESLNIEIIKK